MAWVEVWSIKIDGVEINDITTYVTQIPEIENIVDDEVITVPIDGDYPAYIRNQPVAGQYTIMIASQPCTWSTWNTRISSLRSLLSRGTHTLTVQVRGFPTALSTTIVVRGMMVEAKNRRVVVSTLVPQPLF